MHTEDPTHITHEIAREARDRDRDAADRAEVAKDILRGAVEIAAFLFGDRAKRRAVYHLCATSRLPVFRLGSMLCARRSVLLEWIASQEGWPPPTANTPAMQAPPCTDRCDDRSDIPANASNR